MSTGNRTLGDPRKLRGLAAPALALLLSAACHEARSPVLQVDGVLHLEEHLDLAVLRGSELPETLPEPLVWSFDVPQPDWRPVGYKRPRRRLPRVEPLDDAVRLTLSGQESPGGWKPHGGLYIELPEWHPQEWSHLVVRLRSSEAIDHLELAVNLSDDEEYTRAWGPFEAYGSEVPTIDDGKAHDYILPLEPSWQLQPLGAWRGLGVYLGAEEPVSVDLLSISLIPSEADFAARPVGVRLTQLAGEHRRAVYTHGAASLSWEVEVPAAARLALGLGVLRQEPPVVFRVGAAVGDERSATLLEETLADPGRWAPRSIDLSGLAGETVTLSLEVDTEPGTVALWAAPALSGPPGARSGSRPNVILYILDGGGADYMSLLGYNRSNTPQLERLAETGVLFERAYSNASWTKPSTMSFMTSIPHSALGGFDSETDVLPDNAVTLTELLHGAGYQTAVIVSNPFAGSVSGLGRGPTS